MSNILQEYGSNGQAITVTIASLAHNGQRQSTVIDNTSNKFLDALVALKIKANAAGTSATGYVAIYAFGTVDGGATYSENAGASDAAITLAGPPNVRLLGVMTLNANAGTFFSPVFSIAAAFGGILPDHWGIIIENKSGAALDSTGGNHFAQYQGVYNSVA